MIQPSSSSTPRAHPHVERALAVFSPEVVDTSSSRGAGLFECCGAGQRARLADQCLEVVVEFGVGFVSAGVERPAGGRRRSPGRFACSRTRTCRPISRTGTESRRMAANSSTLLPGHAAAPLDKQHTPHHPPTIVVGPELPGTNSAIKPVGPSLPSSLPWPRGVEKARLAPRLVPGQNHPAGKRPRLHQIQVHPAIQRGEERRAAAHQDRMGDDRSGRTLPRRRSRRR